MSGFKDVLESIPTPGTLMKREEFVDPATNISIVMLTSPLSEPKFFSVLNIQTPNGPVGLNFPIPAADLEAAKGMWRKLAQEALTKFDEQMSKQSKRILVPTPALMPGKNAHG